MVSLNSDRRLQLSMDDDEMLLPRRTSHEHDPVLATANAHGSAHGGAHGSGSRRMRLRTGWSVALGIVLLIGLEVTAFLPIFHFENQLFPDEPVVPFSTRTCVHVFVWLALSALYRFGEIHHRTSRLQGYLSFYRDTQALRRMPLIMLSFGNAVLLLFACIVPTNRDGGISRIAFFEIVVTIEIVLALPPYSYYWYRIYQFNHRPQRSDAAASLTNGHSANQGHTATLEHQADMLRFMHQHARNMQDEIRRLKAKLHAAGME